MEGMALSKPVWLRAGAAFAVCLIVLTALLEIGVLTRSPL